MAMPPSPVAPVALFAALVLSVAAAVPLADAGAGFAGIAIAAFLASLAALTYVVLRTDAARDPRRSMLRAADRFDDGWHRFERDFWAHVEALKTR
jgi:hypothetical protein